MGLQVGLLDVLDRILNSIAAECRELLVRHQRKEDFVPRKDSATGPSG